MYTCMYRVPNIWLTFVHYITMLLIPLLAGRAKSCQTSGKLSIATRPSLYEPSDIGVPIQACKETSLHAALPQHDIKLFGVIQNEFVVRLGREIFVKVAYIESIRFGSRRSCDTPPSCDFSRFRSSSHSRIWSCTVTGSSGFCKVS